MFSFVFFVFILSIWLLHFGGCVDGVIVHSFSSPPFHKNGYSRYSVETYWNRSVACRRWEVSTAVLLGVTDDHLVFSSLCRVGRSVGRSAVGRSARRVSTAALIQKTRQQSLRVSWPTEELSSKIAARWCRNTLSFEGLVWCSMKWAPQWTLLLFTCALKQQALEISQSWNCLIQMWKFQKSRNVELSVFLVFFGWCLQTEC